MNNRPARDTPIGAAAAAGDPAPTQSPGRHGGTGRILRVLMSDEHRDRLPSILAQDVEQVLKELAGENSFQPRGLAGPFVLRLALENGRLLFDIRDADERPLATLGLALGPFRLLMKDYVMVFDSHAAAASIGQLARMEAIDMGRRGLHNEGAQLITDRLRGKIEVDFETARRLFTLVCVLHQRP